MVIKHDTIYVNFLYLYIIALSKGESKHMKHYKIMEIVETHNTTTKTFVSQTFMTEPLASEKVEKLNKIASESYATRSKMSALVPATNTACSHCDRRDFFVSTSLDPFSLFDTPCHCYVPKVLEGTFECEGDECYRVVCQKAYWDLEHHGVAKVRYELVEVDE